MTRRANNSETAYGPLRAYLYHVAGTKAVLDCGHYKYVGHYSPVRRVRCPKCRDAQPRDVSQAEVDRQLDTIRVMKLQVPDPEQLAELVQEFCYGCKTIFDQERVLNNHGWNLSAVGMMRAVEAGTVRHSDPNVPISALVPVGTRVLPKELKATYLAVAGLQAYGKETRPDLIVAEQMSIEWKELCEGIHDLGGEWDYIIEVANRLKTLERIQEKLEAEYANVCPPEDLGTETPGDPMGDS